MISENGITLKNVLQMESFKTSNVIAGKSGLNNIVTKTNVMVDPDILNWVNEGELLLTTAYFFKENSLDDQLEFIKQLGQKKLSGIGIKLKPYLEQLAPEVLSYADDLGLPIISVDYNVSFTDIMVPIFQEIFNKQSAIIKKVEKLHHDTMQLVLKGGGLNEIVKILSENMSHAVIVKDYQFEDCIYEQDNEFDYSNYEVNLNTYIKNNTKKLKYGQLIHDYTRVNGEKIERVLVPISLKNSVYGVICVYGSKERITDFDILRIESISNIIALNFLNRISVKEVENRYKSEFFEDLISHDEKRRQKAVDRASYYKFDSTKRHSVISFQLINQNEEYSEHYDRNIERFMYLIDLICKDKNRTYLTTYKSNDINVLLMWDDAEKFDVEIQVLVKDIVRLINDKVRNVEFKVGIGRIYPNLLEVDKSLEDAHNAINASGTFIDSQVVKFDELGIYKIFCKSEVQQELMDFYEETIKPLVEYDRKRDTELVDTLRVYFDMNGNLKKMSEALFTHYNTALYRINRIQEIIGVDLNDERSRYDLQTALKILKILEI